MELTENNIFNWLVFLKDISPICENKKIIREFIYTHKHTCNRYKLDYNKQLWKRIENYNV